MQIVLQPTYSQTTPTSRLAIFPVTQTRPSFFPTYSAYSPRRSNTLSPHAFRRAHSIRPLPHTRVTQTGPNPAAFPADASYSLIPCTPVRPNHNQYQELCVTHSPAPASAQCDLM